MTDLENVGTTTTTPAEGNIVYAASPSLIDVEAAITLADPGDTVHVPAGSATWVSQLAITKAINVTK